MNPTLILSILSAVTAAVWSVWTWREEQQKEREVIRDREAALFVNSFIQALEELQSRLYGILEGDGLAFFKREYPQQYEFGSPVAIEILYRIAKCFGWIYRTFRYGPYTNDPVVIELVRKIGDTYESHSRFPGDAFRFTYEEGIALGEAVVRRTGVVLDLIPEFESIMLFQFYEELGDKSSKRALLYRSKAVRRTLAAIDQADRPEELEGAERLAVLQNLLVDLLTYLEEMEGFSVSPQKRRRAKLRGAAAEALPAVATEATVVHQTPGRLRLRVPRLKADDTYASRLQALLETVDQVRDIRINESAASVVVSFNPGIADTEFAGRVVKTIETGCATT